VSEVVMAAALVLPVDASVTSTVEAPVIVTLSNNGSANATPIAFVLGMIYP
jgi:hypothetical protein